MKHKTICEGDELTCACGLRWGVGEEDPHPEETAVIGVDMAKPGGDITATQVVQLNREFSDSIAAKQVKECNERLAKIIKSLGE